MTTPTETFDWLAVQFRERANNDPEVNTEKDAHEVEAACACAKAMLAALRAFVDACGGNPPDWLQEEYAAAENAIAQAEDRTDA